MTKKSYSKAASSQARRRRAVDILTHVWYPTPNMNERENMRLMLVIDYLAAGD